MHKLKIEFSKFTVIGAANFIFTFLLFYLLVKIIHINHLISLVIVSLLGMILTYTANYMWVFKPAENLEFRERLVKYILAGLLSITLNLAVLDWIVRSTGFDPFLVQFGLIPMIVVFNFSTAKFWSLKSPNHDNLT